MPGEIWGRGPELAHTSRALGTITHGCGRPRHPRRRGDRQDDRVGARPLPGGGSRLSRAVGAARRVRSDVRVRRPGGSPPRRARRGRALPSGSPAIGAGSRPPARRRPRGVSGPQGGRVRLLRQPAVAGPVRSARDRGGQRPVAGRAVGPGARVRGAKARGHSGRDGPGRRAPHRTPVTRARSASTRAPSGSGSTASWSSPSGSGSSGRSCGRGWGFASPSGCWGRSTRHREGIPCSRWSWRERSFERASTPSPDRPLPLPRRLAELMTDRLAALSDSVRWLLLLLSASVRPTLPSISRALGDPAGFPDDVSAALQADVIELSRERVRLTSPLIGTVVYSKSSAEERRRAHRILADIATDPEERARHLALAADGPDESVAQLLEDAAMRARSRGAPEASAQLAELARGLTPPESGAARVRRTAHAGRYAFESAQMERAQRAARGGRVGGADGTDARGGAAVPQPARLSPPGFAVRVDAGRGGAARGAGGSVAAGEHPPGARGRGRAVR